MSLRESDRHVFLIESPQSYLTEEEALMLAQKTMKAEGYQLEKWRPVGGSPTTSPDGNKDSFLFRGRSGGRIEFKNEENGKIEIRCVDLEMSDGRVTTYVWIPK
jgi:hypothetical protein